MTGWSLLPLRIPVGFDIIIAIAVGESWRLVVKSALLSDVSWSLGIKRIGDSPRSQYFHLRSDHEKKNGQCKQYSSRNTERTFTLF
jgi:hypothetical protein